MKMKKYIFITALLVLMFVSALTTYAIEVTPTGTLYVGDTVSFRPTSSAFGNVSQADWNFGDGATTSVTYGMDTVTHTYTSPGSYTVTVTGQMASTTPITETVTVQIYQGANNRYIEVTPDNPIVGQPSTFRAYNFNTPEGIVWDMGDGTILSTGKSKRSRSSSAMSRRTGFKTGRRMVSKPMGTDVVTHTYTTPGNYMVRAYDFYGDTETPVILNVTVRLPDRLITYSPAQPLAGAPVQFNAANFLSNQIDWNFGDGTTVSGGGISVTHVYNNAGTYSVTANEVNSNFAPVSIRVTVTMPNRQIIYSPQTSRVDQLVYFQAQNFITNGIDWNFGDGTIISGGSANMTHRYQTQGSYTVSAKDSTINHTPISVLVTVLPENRYITVAPPEVRTNETVTVQAFNFRGDYILWDFGNGTQRTGGQTETYAYPRAGEYTITARDENGESQVAITQRVSVKGIDDQVNLEIAEIRLDNGKYYKIIPKNSKNIRAVLRMKMRGTGIVSGFWSIDGHPFEFFNETVSQGMLKEIYTREIPGLPTIEPGIHRIRLTLTRPGDLNVSFPELKYFVLPYENILKAVSPVDGFVCKDKEIPEFSWEEARGANKYQIAFSDHLYPIMNNTPILRWIDVGTDLKFTPGEQTWNSIKRNRWTYWKVRALTTNGEVVAESDIMDIKVVIATAKLSILKVTDLEGKEIRVNGSSLRTTAQDLLVRGSVEYMGNSEYLVLRVYAGNELCDQLLFRDIKKGEERFFETSIPHKSKQTRVFFQVLKTSSPAVVVGITNLIFKK